MPRGADTIQRGLGVLGEGAGDAANVLVGGAGEELPLAIALLPDSRHRKGQQRQGGPRALDALDHLFDEGRLFEPVAEPCRGLHQCAMQTLPRQSAQRGDLGEDRRQARLVVTAHQEVVAKRQHDVDVRVAGESREQRGEARLHLRADSA